MHCFFLGRNTELSLLELEMVFGQRPQLIRGDIALMDGISSPELQQDFLGGTVKITEVLAEATQDQLMEICVEVLEKEAAKGKKIRLALNYFGPQKQDFLVIKKILIPLKKQVSFPMRFVNNNFSNVVSAVTLKQVLQKDGIELNLIERERGRFLITRTLACQNIDAYSDRDYGKPRRDAKVGMLPPKLAQILLNLAQPFKSVWDPFCGTGTVLIEALLAGKKVIGSDLSADMVEACTTNVAWLKERYQIPYNPSEIFQHDATQEKKISVDVVVTEGYLGMPKSKMPDFSELKATDDQLSHLYEKFLFQCKKNKISTIILCLPVYRMQEGPGFMKKTLASILQSGYNLTALSEKPRPTVLYKRDEQFVFREILKLELET